MPSDPAEHRFQVSLDGLIDLLANHLYETPAVFVRELLQNAVDAIDARRVLEPTLEPEIRMELVGGDPGPPTLVFSDNGIGLTEPQVHDFLATIGQSAKRGSLPERDGGYLGQFGVGLLSCFVVAEEVVVITRSCEEGQPALEWIGRADGSYAVRQLESPIGVGTTVFLRFREKARKEFDRARLRGLIRHYGEFLPIPILMVDGDSAERVNSQLPPWRASGAEGLSSASAADFANTRLGFDPVDSFPIRSKTAGVRGLAYVIPQKVNLTAEPAHRVYLKGMLLSDSVSNLLPRWAVFLRCVVDTDRLRPMASREGLVHDDLLKVAQEELAQSIRSTVVRFAESEPGRLARWISIHEDAMKALACTDDQLYRIILPHLMFVTNRGYLSLVAILDEGKEVAYSPTVDAFRQVAGFASGAGSLIVNAGYSHDLELLERVDLYDHTITLKRVTFADFATEFEEPKNRELVKRLEALGERALQPFECRIQVKSFDPVELPALFSAEPEALRQADIHRTAAESNELFGSILGALPAASSSRGPVLFLNAKNQLVHGLADAGGPAAETALQVLYVHALLQAQQPLGVRERKVLEEGLLELIGMGLAKPESGDSKS